MTAYYNEHDPQAAAWLRELIWAGEIAPGDVDERDIRDVIPADLVGYDQCHFFAGIGGWSLALRLAGWPDDRPVWTGSCPCQPFSAAGRRNGTADERHLWPHWFHLIDQRRPGVVLGEQVASKDGLAWFDLVSADLEGAGYAAGAVDLCAAGVGAPHIRQRLWFVGLADSGSERRQQIPGGAPCDESADGRAGRDRRESSNDYVLAGDGENGAARGLAHPEHAGQLAGGGSVRAEGGDDAGRRGEAGRVADADSKHQGSAGDSARSGKSSWRSEVGGLGNPGGAGLALGQGLQDGRGTVRHEGAAATPPSPVNGFWRNAEWLPCRDGKFRPVEPGTFPLAHGVPGRVGLLRGYGNAINPWVAAEVIGAMMEYLDEVAK